MLFPKFLYAQTKSPIFRFGVGFAGSLFAILLVAILWLNEGFFTYTLDDPYIHLALAQNMVWGHYGINIGEFSAPSSSIVWPFLLAPLSRTAVGLYLPLLINVLASVGTIAVFTAVIEDVIQIEGGKGEALKRILLAWLILATNVLGLIFVGMEHSVQVFCVVMIVYGLIEHGRSGHVPSWLVGFIIFAPLVRYDNMAIVAPALLYLLWHRADKPFLLGSVGVVVTVVGFSLFLWSLGLDYLPASVNVKSNVVASGNKLAELWANLRSAWRSLPGFWLTAGGLALLGMSLRPALDLSKRRLAFCLAIGVLLHLLVGRFGWFSRYEIYIWTAVLLGLLYLLGPQMSKALARPSLVLTSYALFLALFLVATPYLITQVRTPLSANNIYEQQYQMHRFVTEYYQRPFAVHDLGYVAYENDDYYVLDLWGLASTEALERRFSSTGSAWLHEMTAVRQIELVMVYDGVFAELPEQWEAVATLSLSRPKALGTGATVTFYATSATAVPDIAFALERMEPSLPARQSMRMME